MEASELRIGNYVLSSGIQVYVTDLSVDNCDGILTTANFEGSCNGVISPIKLTEEWLVNLGFEKNGFGGFIKSFRPNKYNDYFMSYLVGMGMSSISYSLWDTSINGYPRIKSGIEFVHQLQNLYFALTDEELTIK